MQYSKVDSSLDSGLSNYKTTHKREVISVLRGQAMLNMIHTTSSQNAKDESCQILLKDINQVETLAASAIPSQNSV